MYIFAWIFYFHAPDVCHFYFFNTAIVSFSSYLFPPKLSLSTICIKFSESFLQEIFFNETEELLNTLLGTWFSQRFHWIQRKRNWRVISITIVHCHSTLIRLDARVRIRVRASNFTSNQKLVAFSLYVRRGHAELFCHKHFIHSWNN